MQLTDFATLLYFVGDIVSTAIAAISGIVDFLTTDIGDSVLWNGLLQTLLERLGFIDLPDVSTGVTIITLMSGAGIVFYLGYSLIKWFLDIVL